MSFDWDRYSDMQRCVGVVRACAFYSMGAYEDYLAVFPNSASSESIVGCARRRARLRSYVYDAYRDDRRKKLRSPRQQVVGPRPCVPAILQAPSSRAEEDDGVIRSHDDRLK